MTATAARMRAVVAAAPGRRAIEAVPTPARADDYVLVQSLFTALCRSDYALFRGDDPNARYPLVAGHEWCGRVVEAGSDHASLVGEVVIGENYAPCGSCRACEIGRWNLCTNLEEIGFSAPGSLGEFFAVRADAVRPLPAGLPAEAAPLVEPLGVALHGVDRAGEIAGRSVLVVGAGAVGLLVLQICRAAPASFVAAVDPDERRTSAAASLGADSVVTATADALAGNPDLLSELPPFEVVFDVSGVASVFPAALELVAPGGKVVLVGYSGANESVLRPSTIMLKELDVVGVLSCVGTLDRALDLVERRAVRLDALSTAILPVRDHARAEELSGSVARVVLDCSAW